MGNLRAMQPDAAQTLRFGQPQLRQKSVAQ